MFGSRDRSRPQSTEKSSTRSSTFSSPMTVATVLYPASESPLATSRITCRYWAGRCWANVSPPWSVGV